MRGDADRDWPQCGARSGRHADELGARETHEGGLVCPLLTEGITCCLCGKPIPKNSNIYALAEEWRRRFPQMSGILACANSAVRKTYWTYRNPDGSFVAGHRRAAGMREDQDHDSWDHVDGSGTHAAMIYLHPSAAVRQGAEEWLRHIVRRPQLNGDVRARIQEVLDHWDGRAR